MRDMRHPPASPFCALAGSCFLLLLGWWRGDRHDVHDGRRYGSGYSTTLFYKVADVNIEITSNPYPDPDPFKPNHPTNIGTIPSSRTQCASTVLSNKW